MLDEDERWEREGQLEKLVGDQSPNPEAPPRSKIKRERREHKGDVREGATAKEAMKKSRYVGVIEGEEVRRDDPIEYFLYTGVGSTS